MVRRDYKFSVFMVWNDVSRGNQKMNFSVLLHAHGCSLHNSGLLLNSILMKLM